MGLCEQGQQLECSHRGACAATGQHNGSDVDGTSTPDAKDAPAKCFNSDDEAAVDTTVLYSMGIRRHSGPEAYSWQGPVPTVPPVCCTLPGNSPKQPLLQQFQPNQSQQQLLGTGKQFGPYSTAGSNRVCDMPQRLQSSAPHSRQHTDNQQTSVQRMGDLVPQPNSQVTSNRTSRPSRADQPPSPQPHRSSAVGDLSPDAQSHDVPHSSNGLQGHRPAVPVKQQQQFQQQQQVVEHSRDQNPRLNGSRNPEYSKNTALKVGSRDSNKAGGLQTLHQPCKLPAGKDIPAECSLESDNRDNRHSGTSNKSSHTSGQRGSKAGHSIGAGRPQPLLLFDVEDVLYNVASPLASAGQPLLTSRSAPVGSHRQQQQLMHPMQVLRAAGAHISSSSNSSNGSGDMDGAAVSVSAPAMNAGHKLLQPVVQGQLPSEGQQTHGRFTGPVGVKPPVPSSTGSTPTADAAVKQQGRHSSWEAPAPAPPPPPPPPPRRQQIVLVPSQDIRKAPGTLVPLAANSTSSKHLQGTAATAGCARGSAAAGGRAASGVASPPAAPPPGPAMRTAPPAPPAGHPVAPAPPSVCSREAGREAGRNLLQQLQQPHKQQQKQSAKLANGLQQHPPLKQQVSSNQGSDGGLQGRQGGQNAGQGAVPDAVPHPPPQGLSASGQGLHLIPYNGPAASPLHGPSSSGSGSSASNRGRSVSIAGGGNAERSMTGPPGATIVRSFSGVPGPTMSPPAPPGINSSRGAGSSNRGPAMGRPDVSGNGSASNTASAVGVNRGRLKGQNPASAPAAVSLNSKPPGTSASTAPATVPYAKQRSAAANLAPAGPSDEYVVADVPSLDIAPQRRLPAVSKGTAAVAAAGGLRCAEPLDVKQRQSGCNISAAGEGKEHELRAATSQAQTESTVASAAVKAAAATGLVLPGQTAAAASRRPAAPAPVLAAQGGDEVAEGSAAVTAPKANPVVIASCLPEDEDDLLGITPSNSNAKSILQQHQQGPSDGTANAGQKLSSYLQPQPGVMGAQPPPPPRKLNRDEAAAGRVFGGSSSNGDSMSKQHGNGPVSNRPGQVSPFSSSMSPPLPQSGHHMGMSSSGMPQPWVPYTANAVGPAAAGANGHPLGVSGPSGIVQMRHSMDSPAPVMPGVMVPAMQSPQMHHLPPQQYGSAPSVIVKPVPSKRLEIVDPRRKDSSSQLDKGVHSSSNE